MGMEFVQKKIGVARCYKPSLTAQMLGNGGREITMRRLGFLAVVLGQFDVLDSLVFGQRRNAHLSPTARC